MRIRFTVNIEDVVAFQAAVMRTSPKLRRLQFRSAIVNAALAIIAFSTLAAIVNEFLPVFIGLFLAAILVLGPVLRSKKATDAQLRSMADDPANKVYFGEQALEVLAEGLASRNAYGHSLTFWPGIIKIEETDAHAYFYTSAMSAIILPKNSVIEGDANEFIRAVKCEVNRPPAAPPTSPPLPFRSKG